MTTNTQANDPWHAIMELAQRYPSPHNGQPLKLKPLNDHEAALYFDTARGLFASELGYKFSYLTVGVFVEFFVTAARALGYQVTYKPELTPVDKQREAYLHYFGKLEITAGNLAPDAALEHLLRARRTSRKNYRQEPIPEHVLAAMQAALEGTQANLYVTENPEEVKQVLWYNQETLFHDLQTPHMHDELAHWLRYSKREARERRDGLSAECLQMPGPALRFALRFPRLITNKIAGRFFKYLYLRTMKTVNAIAWLQAPFASFEDYIACGRAFMKVWLALSAQGYSLHPYGTIPTNDAVLQKVATTVGATNTDAEPIWMIFRFGKSDTPPESYRLPLANHFVEES